MYNRYIKQVQDVNDYIEIDRSPPENEPAFDRHKSSEHAPHMPYFYSGSEEQHNSYESPPAKPPEPSQKKSSVFSSLFGGEGGDSILGKLFGNFHMPKLEFDDILLLLIIFLMLREDGDDDLILIAAALYFAGL